MTSRIAAMGEPNPRVRAREKFQLSLDGPQVASIVAGTLVVLGVVFVLGFTVGKELAARRGAAGPAGDLDALDRVPVAPAPARAEPLTFHDRLTKDTPAPPPPADAPERPPAAPPAAPPVTAATVPPAPAPEPTRPAAAAAQAKAAPQKAWTIQLAASEDRGEAEKLAARFATLAPRVEEAVVPGKGRFFRVRVGSFDTRDAAQRYLRDVARETGAKGIVTQSR
jgi:cell division septation protein DedD